MIFCTTHNGYKDRDLSVLYPPLDPSYVYPEHSVAYTSSQYKPSFTDDKDTLPGYGIDLFLDNRRALNDSKIQLLLSEISQRHTIKEDNLSRINRDQCSFRTLIFDMGDNVWDKRRTEFERKIIDLEQEKRREQTSYFKDIVFLRKELRESLIEKLEDKQKSELLTDQKEELP
jgi:hypothetical protein